VAQWEGGWGEVKEVEVKVVGCTVGGDWVY